MIQKIQGWQEQSMSEIDESFKQLRFMQQFSNLVGELDLVRSPI